MALLIKVGSGAMHSAGQEKVGQMSWSNMEVKALILIWRNDNVSQMFVAPHRNNDVFRIFRKKIAALG